MKKILSVLSVFAIAFCVSASDYASNSIGQNLGEYNNGIYRLHTEDEVVYTLYENGTALFRYKSEENGGRTVKYTENLLNGRIQTEVYEGHCLMEKTDGDRRYFFEYDASGSLCCATVTDAGKLAYVEFYLRTAGGSLAGIRTLYPDGTFSDSIFFGNSIYENLVLITPGGTVDFSDETLYCTYDGEFSILNIVLNDGMVERRFLDGTGKTVIREISDSFGNAAKYEYFFDAAGETVCVAKTSGEKKSIDYLENGVTVRTEVYENSELSSLTKYTENEKRTELYENGALYVTAIYDLNSGKLTGVVYN